MMLQAPRGTKDIYGKEIEAWIKIEKVIREVCRDFGVSEIRTPIFESTELFQRGIGETTDIVQKEMFTFSDANDKGAKSFTLRPELTASLARAYIEHSWHSEVQPVKLFYVGPNFRKEKPQKGRMRQFHQFGVEMYGAPAPYCDAETIALAYEFFRRIGINNIELRINSLGGVQCRAKYNETLKKFIGENIQELCPLCQERFEKNPLRVLDCKVESCIKVLENAPASIDVLDKECHEHFETLKEILTSLEIPFKVDAKLVRGLDYYTRTIFEFVSGDIGAQAAVLGGGRYDNLIEDCGGQPTAAIGFAIGIERVLLVLESLNSPIVSNDEKVVKDIYIGSIGKLGNKKAQTLAFKLKQEGIIAESDIIGKSVKAQMKYADKTGAKYSLIIGEDEINNNQANVKNMETGEQIQLSLDNLSSLFK